MAFLKETHPEIFNSILRDKDYDFDVDKLSTMSAKKVYIICENGHERYTSVSHIVRGNKCMQCTYPIVEEGYSYVADYLTDQEQREEFLKEKQGSTKKYSFTCPFTSSKKSLRVSTALNTIEEGKPLVNAVNYVELPKEYMIDDYDYPESLPKFSKKVLPWKCELGHTWKSQAGNLLGRNRFCPYCENRELLVGFNDLLTFAPKIQEWLPNIDASEILMMQHYQQEVTCPECESKFIYNFHRNYNKKGIRNTPICPECDYGMEIREKTLKEISPIAYKWYSPNNPESADEIKIRRVVKREFICDEGHVFEKRMDTIKERGMISCPECNVSSGELWLRSIIEENYNGKILYNDRSVLPDGKELDVYLPDEQLAFEFNGIYWHKESTGKDKFYHYNKWKNCDDRNIQLMSIWEDEYINNRVILEKTIARKIHQRERENSLCHNYIVKEISEKIAKNYFENNHVYGFSSGDFYIGLFQEDNLISASIWKEYGNELFLERYASNKDVVSNMLKIICYLEKQEKYSQKYTHITTISSNCLNENFLFRELGFIKEKDIAPDYKYLVKNSREHKFNYRKNRFKTDSELLYDPSLTEKQLADLNGLHRIWDCGKIKWCYYF